MGTILKCSLSQLGVKTIILLNAANQNHVVNFTIIIYSEAIRCILSCANTSKISIIKFMCNCRIYESNAIYEISLVFPTNSLHNILLYLGRDGGGNGAVAQLLGYRCAICVANSKYNINISGSLRTLLANMALNFLISTL